jgi:MFS family permease
VNERSASSVRGRVFSAFGTLGLMANAVAFAIAGSIVEAFGPRSVFALGAVASALCLPFLRPLFRNAPVGSQLGASDA